MIKEHVGTHAEKIIKARNVAVLDPHAVQPAPVVPPGREHRVRLIKDGEVVKTIEIRCACGEIIRLDCEY